MSKYTKIAIPRIINSSIGNVEICKFQKAGTKRIFWTPEFNGKRIVSTMYARQYDAVKVANMYISWKKEQGTK